MRSALCLILCLVALCVSGCDSATLATPTAAATARATSTSAPPTQTAVATTPTLEPAFTLTTTAPALGQITPRAALSTFAPLPTATPYANSPVPAITQKPGSAGIIVFDGDSRSVGDPDANDQSRLAPSVIAAFGGRSSDYRWVTTAISGQRQTAMTDNYAKNVAPLCIARYSRCTLVLWGGVNDLLNGDDPFETYQAIVAEAQAAHRSGYKVVVGTVPPGESAFTGISLDPTRGALAYFNFLIRANQTDFDALGDIAADPRFAYSDAQESTVLYWDKLHLSGDGNEIVARIVVDALHTLGL